MNIKSEQLESINCVIGKSTRKPNSVTMTISSTFMIEVVALFELLKAGKKPKTGLCGLKLIAEYVEDIEDSEKQMELIEGMSDSLQEIAIKQDEIIRIPAIDLDTGDVEGDRESLSVDESDQDEFRDGEK